jgi:dihydrofolate synthase/folylpolyglutamate synthase
MDYRESVDYLLSFADFERSGRFQDRPDVAPVLALLRGLGDPHLGRRTVHIAGSKGKGSVAAMVESVLRAAGHSTGLFTSPHLHSYTERIRVNGEPLAEGDWARLTGVLGAAVEAEAPAPEGRRLVTFDLLTALAFLAFRESAVRCQVLEAGLGGRVDSTNVFERKEVCAITAIGLEHTEILGDTVEEIAGEKAGIITPGADVVIGPQQQAAARKVIRRAAEGAGWPDVRPEGAGRAAAPAHPPSRRAPARERRDRRRLCRRPAPARPRGPGGLRRTRAGGGALAGPDGDTTKDAGSGCRRRPQP